MDYRQITFPTIFPRVNGVNYHGQGFIENLVIKSIYPGYIKPTILSVGERIYNNNTWLITHCDLNFNKVCLLKTNFERNTSTETNEISFYVNEPATVYVAYDEKGSSNIPDWLAYKFQRTSKIIKSNQGQEFQLYKIVIRKGKLTLGGNASGVSRPGFNYFVLIENQKNENIITTRSVVDNTVNQIKFTSDYMIQMYRDDILIHNIWCDPLFEIYLNDQNQFVQNGLSILDVFAPNFLEQVNELNDGIQPFEPLIENFIPNDRQPGINQTYLEFIEQEPLTNPNILIGGTTFTKSNNDARVNWYTANSNRVLFNKREVDFKGSLLISSEQTTYYTFRVEADENILITNYNLQIENQLVSQPVLLPKLTLKSNKKNVFKEETVTLEWYAENYDQLFLGDTQLNTNSGSLEIEILNDTEFKLSALNSYLNVEISLLIRVKN